MAKVFSEVGKGFDNIPHVLEWLLQDVDVSGRDILLKPNMVDPSSPEACSHPLRLQAVADVLNAHGAREILVGDEPAHYFFELHGGRVNVFEHYDALGYSRIRGVRLIDLDRELGTTDYDADRVNPITARTETITIPVRNTAGLIVVSFAMPKHHGNFNYSGATKNLMGLVPHDDRIRNFHYSFADSFGGGPVPARAIHDFVDDFTARTGEDKYNPNEGLVAPAYARHLVNERDVDIDSLVCHLEHVINAGAIYCLAEHIRMQSPGSFAVLDGTHLMRKHEHAGETVFTDFAMAGQDPVYVDSVALAKLGINPVEVPYIAAPDEPQVVGYIGGPLEEASLIPKEGFHDQHGIPFLRVRG